MISLKEYNRLENQIKQVGVEYHLLEANQLVALVEDILYDEEEQDCDEEMIDFLIRQGICTENTKEFKTFVKENLTWVIESKKEEDLDQEELGVTVTEQKARAPKLRGIKKKMKEAKSKVLGAANRDERFLALKKAFKKKAEQIIKKLARKEGLPANKIDLSKIKI